MTESSNTLLIVDALNLAFRWKHQGVRDFAEDYLRTVESLKRSYKAKWVIIAADKGSSSYRKALWPGYKQNRKDKFAEQTEAEKEAFELFFQDYEDTLKLLRVSSYPVLQYHGTEADDIGAYISSVATKYGVEHTWLMSSDKDWDLLVGTNVSRFSYVTRKEVTLDNWHDHYECTPEQYISIKCLQGDSGDNVIGVSGIGPKRALELVNKYGSAMDIVANLPISSKLKYVQILNESGELIMLNYQLMDLVTFCRDALGDNVQDIDKVLTEYIQ